MEVHIHSVKAKSQPGKQRHNDTQLEISKIYAFCEKIQQRSRRERCWGYIFVHDNIFKKLLQLYVMVQGSVQLEHGSHIGKVGVKATC